MIKKNPSFRVTIYPAPITEEEPFVLEYPLTCRFNSQRGTFSQANKCTIEIYNLAETTRSKIFKDALVGDLEEKNWKFIKLEAGWNGQLSQIFYGRILQAYSSKTGGQTDIITRIECLPFDIFASQSSYTFAAGTSYKEAYKTMASDLPQVQIGNTGNLEGTFKTQTTFEGNTLECLNQLTGGNTFVDNGILNTLMANEVIEVPIPLVTDSNGLLSTPIRRLATLTIKMLFEPSLIVGQLLEIKSSTQSEFDGQYKVLGFNHDCTISPTQAGQRITTVDLWAIPTLARTDINITNEEITGGASDLKAYKVKGEDLSPIGSTNIYPKWIWPCYGSISGQFGEKRTDHTHNGIDIAVKIGTPIKAIADGTICAVGSAKGYGYWVAINHGIVNGVQVTSEYGHISRWCVSNGQKVKQGQVIAYSGNTGYSQGPHCHLTIRQGAFQGKAVSPWIYLNRK